MLCSISIVLFYFVCFVGLIILFRKQFFRYKFGCRNERQQTPIIIVLWRDNDNSSLISSELA